MRLTEIPGGAVVPRLRRGRVLSALGAVATVAMMIGIIVGGGLPDASKGASTSGPPAAGGSGTGTVERRDLISTDTQSGTLGYADARTVFNRVSGTITWLPAAGTQVKAGQQLYQVDGTPVILFDGAVPAYRTLTSGISDGPDVAELKRNLIGLGLDPGHAITVNNTFDSATTDAINRWQASLGLTQTGSIDLGRVVFLPGSRRISSVQGVLGSTGGSAGAGGSGSGGSSSSSGSTTGASFSTGSGGTSTRASASVGQPSPTFVSFRPSSSTPKNETGSQTATATCTDVSNSDAATISAMIASCQQDNSPSAKQLLAQLVAQLKKLVAEASRSSGGSGGGTSGRSGGGGGASASAGGASAGASASRGGSAGASSASGGASGGASGVSGGASGGASGGGSGAATAIMQTTSAQLAVTVNLDATKQSEATVGEPVSVQLSDGSNDSGKITAVSSVAQSSSSSSGSAGSAGGSAGGSTSGGATSATPTATVPVTIALTGNRRVAGLDQSAVSVNFQQQVRRGALAVPVTALLATAGGGYAVQTIGQNGQRQLVPVTPGLFAGGYVEVTGSSLTEGMRVSASQG